MKEVGLWVLIIGCIFAAGFVGGWHFATREPEPLPVVRVDTVEVVRRDTIRETETRFVREVVVDTMFIEVAGPTIEPVPLAIVQREFAGEHYRAWVSGVTPWLDSIEIEKEIVERVITKEKPPAKPKRWSLGVSGGVTYDFAHARPAPYVGVGVNYNLLFW